MRIIKLSYNILSLIILILWMIGVFILSNFPANISAGQSSSILEKIIFPILDMVLENNEYLYNIIQIFIRKSAHLTLYILGGMIIFNFLYNYFSNLNITKYSIVFGGIYAITDEIHQYFVPGRSMQITDILIDFIGVLIGVFMIKLIYTSFKGKEFNE